MVYFCHMTSGAKQVLRMRWAAYASIGAGVIHGVAVGLHADHAASSRVFMALTVAQVGWGLVAVSRVQRRVVVAGFVINGAAVAGWVLARTTGIWFIPGLETAENPQVVDTLSALLAIVSVFASLWAMRGLQVPIKNTAHMGAVFFCSAVTVLALWSVTGYEHVYIKDVALTDAGLSINANGVIVSPTVTSTSTTVPVFDTTSTVGPRAVEKTTQTTPPNSSAPTTVSPPSTIKNPHSLTTQQALAAASGWPRAWDGSTIDFSGINGVTTEQVGRATALLNSAKQDLPKYANTESATADGYVSIGDALTGFEHFIKYSLLTDGRVLDTKAPESLVYLVKGASRTLVSAMFIANPGTPLTDTTLVNYAGGLMQWHVHSNLCWVTINGVPKVVGVTNAAGNCLFGTLQTGGAPMVHVWITPHVCGPFAALEGNGAGVAEASDAERVDFCNKDH